MLKIENKVVIRFRDRRIVKGGTYNFKSHREIFHVTEAHDEKKTIEISIGHHAEDHGHKSVGESVPAEGWIFLKNEGL